MISRLPTRNIAIYFFAAVALFIAFRVGPKIAASQPWSSAPSFTVSDVHNFNGTNQDAALGDLANLKITGGLTIDAWVNPNSLPAANSLAAIATKWNESIAGNSYGLWLENNSGMLRIVGAINPVNGAQETVIGGAVPLNSWTHVAMTYDPATSALVIYQNGNSAGATLGRPSLIKSTNTNAYIGSARDGAGQFFSGAIGQVEVFNRTLSASEIDRIAKAPSPAITATATPTPTPSPSPTPTPHLELNGQGTIVGPRGPVSFVMSDIEMDQVTAKYFEGKLNFNDSQTGLHFASQRITSVTINPNRTSATFSGQSNDKSITYTVTVTANQHPTTGDAFSITTNKGYSASGNLTSGAIGISIAP